MGRKQRREGGAVKLNYWRISVKTAIVAVLVVIMTAFERLVHPVVSAQSAVAQLADTVDSSSQMAAYGWIIPVGWFVTSVIAFVFVVTEVRATVRTNNKKEEVR